MAGVAVERVATIGFRLPLPELVRENQIGTVLEFRPLNQAGLLAIGTVDSGAVIAKHTVIPAACIGHRADIGSACYRVDSFASSKLEVDCFVFGTTDGHAFDAPDLLVFEHIVLVRTPLVKSTVLCNQADGNAASIQDCAGIGLRDYDSGCSGFGDSRRIAPQE